MSPEEQRVLNRRPGGGERARTIYYASNSNFEQSLDVYVPSSPLSAGCPPLPLVVLVVGSAWLGHRSIIYAGTSWWNSSGPRAVAGTGAVCVCVRHRGAFPRSPPWYVTAVLALVFWPAFPFVLLVALAWYFAARGAATHDDMLEDVCTALKWVLANRATTLSQAAPAADGCHAAAAAASAASSSPPPTLVFGGYSSGAHVAVSLLQRPELLAASELPPPSELCSGVLLLSGVLGTRLTQPRTSAASPALTDIILRACWGSTAAAALPSPVHSAERSPPLPHLLLGCEHEVFGLPLVEAAMNDVLFCSREFTRRLVARGVSAELVEVRSDHWFVLGSKVLHDALMQALCVRGWPNTGST